MRTTRSRCLLFGTPECTVSDAGSGIKQLKVRNETDFFRSRLPIGPLTDVNGARYQPLSQCPTETEQDPDREDPRAPRAAHGRD